MILGLFVPEEVHMSTEMTDWPGLRLAERVWLVYNRKVNKNAKYG